MLRDRLHANAFKAAARATRTQIRRDRARTPASLKKVFTVVAQKLFDPSLNATLAWREAGVKDHALRAAFRDTTGTSLGRYIAEARIEVASVLIATTDLDLTSISLEVGYLYHQTFTDNFKRLRGKLPSEVERELLSPPLIDDGTSLKAGRGLLDEEELVRHIEELVQLCPSASQRVRIDPGVSPQATC